MNEDGHQLLRDYGSIEPGEYDCDWTIGGEHVRGQVELRAGRPPIGFARTLLHDGRVPGRPGVREWVYPHHRDAPVIRGFIESQGKHITFLDVRLTAEFTDRVSIAGRIALVTKNEVPEDATFTSISFQVTKLDRFTALTPIDKQTLPGSDGPPYTFGATSTSLKREWPGNEVKATFWYGYRSAIDPFIISVKFAPWMEFTSSTPLSASDWITKWCLPLAKLISVATGDNEQVTLATLTAEGDPKNEAGMFANAISQQPYYSGRKSPDLLAFTVGDGDFSLVHSLELWNQLSDAGHPLIAGYNTVALGSNQHPQARVLLLLQWLEGSYGFDHRCEFAERQVKHTGVRDALMVKLQAWRDSGELTSPEFRMSKRVPREAQPTLGEALSHYLELHANLNTEEVLRKNALVARLLDSGSESVVDAMRVLRNGLSHGTATYDPYELLELVEVLHLLVRAEYLRLLGGSFDVESVRYR